MFYLAIIVFCVTMRKASEIFIFTVLAKSRLNIKIKIVYNITLTQFLLLNYILIVKYIYIHLKIQHYIIVDF